MVTPADAVEQRPEPATPEPTTSESGSSEPESQVERIAAFVLIGFTFVFAFVVQSLFFHTSTNMHGDVAYHRGVGLEMLGGDVQGEGPFRHLMAYFGGLYPLGLAYGSHWLGVSFDRFLSVLSWFATLALPAVLIWLGRRIWPRRWLEPALLGFLGTVGSSMATDKELTWVKSVLPSGANLWPLYPRDVALVLVIAAFTVTIGGRGLKRAAVVGVILALTFSVHAQLGFYGLAIVGSYGLWRAWRDSLRSWAGEIGLTGLLAFGLSAWWWWPRLDIVLDTRTLLLQSWPGRPSPSLSPEGVLVALGFVGVLAVPGIVLAFRRQNTVLRYSATWLAVSVPLALGASALGDAGLITDRRVWLFAAIPMVICATVAAAALVRKAPLVPALLVIVAVISWPSVQEARMTRDTVILRWSPAATPDLFADATWDPVLSHLSAEVRKRGNVVVIAPDEDADFVWAGSGAQPLSLWLPGSIKLGFDPKAETGMGYLTRLHTSEAAFTRGLGAVCALARRNDGEIILRHDGALLGTHDVRPSAKYRVGPKDRTKRTLVRVVAPKTTYEDRNLSEVLVLDPGATLKVGFAGAPITMVDVILEPLYPDSFSPHVTMRFPDGTEIRPEVVQLARNSIRLRFQTPNGVPPGARLVAADRNSVIRIIGYERVRGFDRSGTGPVIVDQAAVCPSA
ncbi:MAG: hypothetical protein ACXVJW_18710 [Acidimicrobiia bacterium]